MGLRINTNINAVRALRNLGAADRAQTSSLERLSTGLRINRASDDPSGLVISEQLRAQIGSLKQAIENSEFASNLVGTADAALTEVNNLLVGIRESAIFALNTGGTSAEQIAAEQDAVDSAIASIDRIAATTRFGSNSLLNGTSGFDISSQATAITELRLQSMQFETNATSRTFNTEITREATRARIRLQINNTAGAVATGTGVATGAQSLRITGALGTEQIILGSGSSVADVVNSINAVRSNTGVFAALSSGTVGAGTAVAAIFSEEYGSAEKISLEVLSGDDINLASGLGAATDVNPGGEVNTTGIDIGATINGALVSTKGNVITVVSQFLSGDIRIADGTAVTGSGSPLSFVVQKSGLDFQLNIEARASDLKTLGLPNVSSYFLGAPERTLGTGSAVITSGGFLNSLVSGGANDLATNPGNAVTILDNAIDDITALRGYLGAFEADTLESNINSLGIALENLTSTESEIRDLDFAAETSEFTRSQILFAAGVQVLASANLVPQSVLNLLG